ncbi:MAG TPA: DNA/RNA non-specific endonuclease [Pyrinomonadaceae bacterium]|jgi:endonuclease G|nr:DNA/RNA non-specific endonuclease [Pyrinomonadaceae bacterium]
MRKFRTHAALACALALLVALSLPFKAGAQAMTEGFESGSKTAYAAANVFLSTGWWFFDDALIGNLSTDRKTGAASARIRNVGAISTNFDFSSAGTVTVQHAVFSSDGASSWELWASTNGGSSYSKVGSTVSTTSTTLQTATFNVNSAGAVRLSIRKVSGGANRINIDNVTVNPSGAPPPPAGEHLTMGNPSNATADVNQPSNYLLDKPQYAVSYNRDKGRPNWVSWHLDSTWLGSTARQDDFRNDTTLPAGWYQVQGTDYTGSGFDRGHHCPSGDRTSTVADNSATFLMSNMMPQAPDNNQGPWEALESYCRTLVSSGDELYIIAGGSGSGGTGSNGGTTTTIASGHVAVPSQTWKVIMVLPVGTNDVSRVTTSTRTIAVILPNTQGIRANDWRSYRVSVDQVEALTGYDFFSNVPVSIQNVIEATVDNQ